MEYGSELLSWEERSWHLAVVVAKEPFSEVRKSEQDLAEKCWEGRITFEEKNYAEWR